MDLARNKEKKFHHGWFVVRNRTPSEVEANIEDSERLEKEHSFFDQQPWNGLSSHRRGTEALKNFLTTLLCSRIERAFPKLLKDITALRNETMSELQTIGTPRTSIESKRAYLTKLAQDFKDRASQSLDGRYLSTMSNDTKLRMKVCEANDTFALKMRIDGHSVPFKGQDSDKGARDQPGNTRGFAYQKL